MVNQSIRKNEVNKFWNTWNISFRFFHYKISFPIFTPETKQFYWMPPKSATIGASFYTTQTKDHLLLWTIDILFFHTSLWHCHCWWINRCVNNFWYFIGEKVFCFFPPKQNDCKKFSTIRGMANEIARSSSTMTYGPKFLFEKTFRINLPLFLYSITSFMFPAIFQSLIYHKVGFFFYFFLFFVLLLYFIHTSPLTYLSWLSPCLHWDISTSYVHMSTEISRLHIFISLLAYLDRLFLNLHWDISTGFIHISTEISRLIISMSPLRYPD